jgi:hypothetical protein
LRGKFRRERKRFALMHPTTSSACKHASETKSQQQLLSSNVLLLLQLIGWCMSFMLSVDSLGRTRFDDSLLGTDALNSFYDANSFYDRTTTFGSRTKTNIFIRTGWLFFQKPGAKILKELISVDW